MEIHVTPLKSYKDFEKMVKVKVEMKEPDKKHTSPHTFVPFSICPMSKIHFQPKYKHTHKTHVLIACVVAQFP